MITKIGNKIKTAGAVLLQTASTITEKEQLLCNTHNGTISQIIFMSFHQPGTGREKRMHISPRN